jgi:hypothetical protein
MWGYRPERSLRGPDRPAAAEKQKDLTFWDGESAHALVAQHCLEAEDAEVEIGRLLQRLYVERALENASDRWPGVIHSLRTQGHRSGFSWVTTIPWVATSGLDLQGVELSRSQRKRPMRLLHRLLQAVVAATGAPSETLPLADLAVLVALLAGFYMLLMCAAPR